MNLQQLKTTLLSLNPYDVVDCGMENFSPYLYLKLPQELKHHIKKLSVEDTIEWDDWTHDVLYFLEKNGSWTNYKDPMEDP